MQVKIELSAALSLALAIPFLPVCQGAEGRLDRAVLPVAEPQYPPIKELDVRNAKAPPRFEVKAPEGAPNVLVVLVDDLGFAGTSSFGGPVSPPPSTGSPARV